VVYYYIEREKLTIAKLKSSCLSYNVVVRQQFESILSKISRYIAETQ
jgi:hypothetical protein